MRINPFTALIVLITLCFHACDTTKKSAEEQPADKAHKETANRYNYDIKKISEKADDCPSGECTRIEVNYPVFANNANLNEVIERQVKTNIADFIMEAEGDEDLDVLTTMFMDSYQEFKESFPESEAPWTVETDVIVSATTPNYISFAFNTNSYTGGAHPNSSIIYLNLTPEGKEIKDLAFFFNDVQQLQKIAEDLFRKKYALTPDDNLAEKGFVFDNDSFSLTENFGFTNSAVIFYYNSYDIAPYAQGPTALLIPLSTLAGNYKF